MKMAALFFEKMLYTERYGMKHILLVRSGPYQVDPNSYNLQEIGLAAAFANYGIKCDVVYYHKRDNYNEKFKKGNTEVKVLWRRGIRLLRSGIYPELLESKFLSNYDAVICSEYSQIMSVLFAKKIKTYIYNGPYYNLFKLPFIEPIYDKLFSKKINDNVELVFCKTKLAENYLNNKGIMNTVVTGVGLDTEKFDKDLKPDNDTKKLLSLMKNHRNILYIGSISKRKNVEFLIRVFNSLSKKKKYDDVNLVIIGNGRDSYVKYCKSLENKTSVDRVLWVNHLENSQTKYIYAMADLFLLASTQEIFGMVLLEAMYFGVPVVSSNSAGAQTLIKNGENGYIVPKFNELDWLTQIQLILDDTNLMQHISENAHSTILTKFSWKSIAQKMAYYINHG